MRPLTHLGSMLTMLRVRTEVAMRAVSPSWYLLVRAPRRAEAECVPRMASRATAAEGTAKLTM